MIIKIKKNIKLIKISYDIFWTECYKYSYIHGNKFIFQIEYLLNEFGTKMPCNRFDVGNCIEYIIVDYLKKCKLKVEHTPNARRNDIIINNELQISIKYSSVGNITLHNSNSHINTDLKCNKILLLTNTNIYLIIPILIINEYNIDFNKYLINTGDSLKLKRSILKILEKNKYKYILNIHINVNKQNCKNRLCSELFYKNFKREIKKLIE